MKTPFKFSNISLMGMLIVLAFTFGCMKENENKTLASLTLTATQTNIAAGGSTKITASGIDAKSCCNLTYIWLADKGSIAGNGSEATYTAPVDSAQNNTTVICSCTANDGCGHSITKSIVLAIH